VALDAGDGLLDEVAAYILKAGGKRLRPALVLLCAQTGPRGPAGAALAMPLAVACEILHTATLIHDDIVDRATVRRGCPTVNVRWGDRVAILAGDFLFARALTFVSELGHVELTARFGHVVQQMCRAEIEQVVRAYDLEFGEAEYLGLIRSKSALLIAECCRCGALVAGAPPEVGEALFRYGEHMGIAFQIADDILDLVAESRALGKPTGGDIGIGLLTLPVIRALRESEELRSLVTGRLQGPGQRERALEIVRASQGVDYARRLAEDYVARAAQSLSSLPAGETREALAEAARDSVRRSH
jgi:geranylgeranyl pyrophosphate synthase